MKVVILAGGLGTRISEETDHKPKPMIEIGGRPILWHILKIYSHYGLNDFIICCGYKGYAIKEYFKNYLLHQSDVIFDLKSGSVDILEERTDDWKITLVDTGEFTMTGGRLLKIKGLVEKEESFCMTYGDGLSNVKLDELIKFHNNHGKSASVTAVHPPSRFGSLEISENVVTNFEEKPKGEGGLINGGFFVLNPSVLSKIDGDGCVWEQSPMRELASEGNLMAFQHNEFWQPMDTLRDKLKLEDLWSTRKAPWKIWK
jgi:glucose-1-phosphate cytidylyltransferase